MGGGGSGASEAQLVSESALPNQCQSVCGGGGVAGVKKCSCLEEGMSICVCGGGGSRCQEVLLPGRGGGVQRTYMGRGDVNLCVGGGGVAGVKKCSCLEEGGGSEDLHALYLRC